ncbi:MAG: ABC transporter substrate-binding protein [Candidatus Kapabacteria bacterium]|nr:ABC transporter substrate-binding protein [Candidatus Kapabacteria bacterium]
MRNVFDLVRSLMPNGLRRSLTVGLTICSCLVISCGGREPSPAERSDTFCYNEPDGIASLDPATASYRSATWAGSHLFNGLVELDSALRIVPSVARSWSVDPSGVEWTFTLRTDVWFHRDPCFGPATTRRVTAHDVKYSIERICDAATKSTGLWAFRTTILGADAFHGQTRRGERGSIDGIRVVNDSVVTIRLTKPFAPFLAVLTMPYAWIVPHEAVRAYGANFGRHPVGTGPFKFHAWTQDVELLLQRNTQYFKVDSNGQRLPYLEHVRISFLRDPKNEFLEFTRGRLDMVTGVDGAFAATIFDASGALRPPYDTLVIRRAAAQSIEYYGILLDSSLPAAKASPFATSRLLRQALNYAIDRHRIVTYVLHGRGTPASHGVLPPGMPGFADSVRGYVYDPDRARQLMAEAGYPNGHGLPSVVLQLGNSERTAAVAEAVQEMWRSIGVRVELRMIDFPQHLAMVRAGDLTMWRTSWMGDYPDPENFLALFRTATIAPKGPNTTRISRHDLDALYEEALSPTRSLTERAALYHRMERIILDEAPWVFLYHDLVLRLMQRSVQGLSVDGSDRLILERVHKTRSM